MISGNSLVLTPSGYKNVKSKPSKVWNGFEWINPNFKPEGKQKAVKLITSNGVSLILGLDTEVPLEDSDSKDAQYLVSGDYLKRFACTQVHGSKTLLNQETERVPLEYSKVSKQRWLVNKINKQGSYALKVEDSSQLVLLLHTLGVFPDIAGNYTVRIPSWCLEEENSKVTASKLANVRIDVVVRENYPVKEECLYSFTGLVVTNGILVGKDECK